MKRFICNIFGNCLCRCSTGNHEFTEYPKQFQPNQNKHLNRTTPDYVNLSAFFSCKPYQPVSLHCPTTQRLSFHTALLFVRFMPFSVSNNNAGAWWGIVSSQRPLQQGCWHFAAIRSFPIISPVSYWRPVCGHQLFRFLLSASSICCCCCCSLVSQRRCTVGSSNCTQATMRILHKRRWSQLLA